MSRISDFITKVQSVYQTRAATEHSYRSALETLLDGLEHDVTAINEPKRVACGAPDFIVQKGDIAIGHVEAKDIGVSLRGMKDTNKAQQDRYRKALSNLIYTNCLDWDFYRDGALVASVTIADLLTGIQPIPEKYETLENLLKNFIAQQPQTITSPRDLAERMAGKAQLIKDVLQNTLKDKSSPRTELADQYEAFKKNLIHDITLEDFADIYAETIAYGMFAARLHDTTLDTFSRQEALELLPKSNPFLRSLFTFVAGYDLDGRIAWIIDDLAQVFQACDVAKLMEGFGKLTGQQDPFLHFYETFLAAYNPSKRKARGVWYTPEPVVNFIVRAVDEALKTEFGLPDGLADTSKVTIDWDTGQRARTRKGDFRKDGANVIEKRDVHRVQILDPATGTGTFLAEVIKQIAPKVKDVAPGMWSQYIEKDLIPRVHGFELLMASYAMCHMKLDMILTELGYQPTSTPPRLSVFLTNSLEEGEPANQTLPFTQWLSREAKGANTIKRDMPIMCIVGNPPYSGISQNMGEWISEKIESYKYVDGQHFGEKKHWLHDDYVKFIRLSESLIEKNGEGILGLITNHGYLSNPTFRGMRNHLLKTFDKIFIFDLHGNANRKEICPDGTNDQNVFDIRQGVAIIIAIRNRGEDSGQARVYRQDLWGRRSKKYEELFAKRIDTSTWTEIAPFAPYYMFYEVSKSELEAYENGTPLTEIFSEYSVGAVTGRDGINVSFSMDEAIDKISRLKSQSEYELRRYFGLKENDARDWKLPNAIRDAKTAESNCFRVMSYRPFDERITCYTGNSRGLYASPQKRVLSNFLSNDNIGLCFNKTIEQDRPFSDCFVFSNLMQHHSLSLKEVNYIAPLYIVNAGNGIGFDRASNIKPKYIRELRRIVPELSKSGGQEELTVFDFIYGILHSQDFRNRFHEFLRIDFPKIPWPSSPDEFWEISSAGSQLRKLHLMDPSMIGQTPYPFVGDGDNVVSTTNFKDGKVWINKTQYFDNAPDVAWDLYIGGYQPAQKWLVDRKGRALSFSDAKHYQRILKVLAETDRIMKAITVTLEM
ncbi:type ISP restriction/modification enzyme [Magnetospirillum fulvum]|uniref:site-specific DNA-methyltransferase (adenine-specific) n=1 Tax=Magnetospirillum fulvum TaxID=1082 RepID=A0A1H6H2Q3_MAGFU|nr:type ISP restriction/modification enzyme [Magnetospirillum fulvum]SEH28478.1 N-6 DNA Methylase [Magnetospirillum fulvum]